MEPESTDQSFSILGPPVYISPERPISTALYSQRFHNDRLLSEIIETTLSNNNLATRIASQNQECPAFLSHWWKKGTGAAEIPKLLGKVSKVLMKETETMEAAIKESRLEQEYIDLQMDNQIFVEEKLIKEQIELQNTLTRLRVSNNEKQKDLQDILSQRQNIFSSIQHLQDGKNILILEKSLIEDQNRKISASFPTLPLQKAQEQYHTQLASFFTSFLERRQQVEVTASHSKGELNQINAKIDHYEKESKLNQARKERIMQQHVELKKLKEELVVKRQRRVQAEKQRAALEQLYCEQQMEKMANENLALHGKMRKLMQKTSELVMASLKESPLSPIQAIVSRQQAL